MKMKPEQLLTLIYKNPKSPGSCGGLWPFYVEAKKSMPEIKMRDDELWLKNQDTYTLHKQAYRKFKRNRIYVGGVDHQWELDLVDMQQHSLKNDGFRYMLTCIDSFSKMAWAIPLKDKSASSIVNAFQKILVTGPKPYRVRTDKGKEFVNLQFEKMLRSEGIDFFTSQNDDIKCAIIDRFNRTLKSRMYRYFTENKTRKWVNIIDDLVFSYNNSYHRSIQNQPVNITIGNEAETMKILYNQKYINPSRLVVGDNVRISIYRHPFAKGYLPQWSDEIFRIYKVLKRSTEPLYSIVDLQDDEITGTFYEKELQKIHFDKDKSFTIETVLKKRKGYNSKVQLFVKWLGYPDKFNEWIDQDYLT